MGVAEELSADMAALLRAGQVEFPARAAAAAEAAGLLATETDHLNAQSALAGDPQVLADALRLCGDAHDGLRVLVERLNYCSQGLIEMVRGYAGSDAEAAIALNLIGSDLAMGSAPAPVTVPLAVIDPEAPDSYGPGNVVAQTPQPQNPQTMLAEHDEELAAQAEPELPEVPL